MAIFKADKSKKQETPILLYPPIIEAIFELRWEIEGDPQSERMRDPSYPMMYGSLYERMKKDFPVIEDLPSVQAHPEATPYIPRHRMRKDRNAYPLIQVGPGIVTVNLSKGYAWDAFRSLILRIVESVIDLYPTHSIPLNFTKSELRFVNGIRFDLARENPISFLADKLHMKLELDPEIFERNPIHDRPNAVGLNLSFVLDKPMGHLGIAANLGQFEGKPAFIQQTLIQSFGELAPADSASFTPWLEEAHDVAETCFQIFCKGELMEKFCGA
ncbi:MAG: TIGR04255 family protein [Verrucomicrobia bacterium]|nr:TIGR04255 family protein [Verrucomicrobiota bacterium]MDE3047865.1 TIGR04255 family protein [Verrucomicrobiota bacterium]